MRNQNGITLIALTITIIVLLILVSISTYSGINIVQSTKMTAFTSELKIMQTQVNEIYQKYKKGDTIKIDDTIYYGENEKNTGKETMLEIGEPLTDSIKTQAAKIFAELEADASIDITGQEGYRYWSQEDVINKLGIEGVKQDLLVNLEKRSVISYEGFKYEDKMYYTLQQLPNELYNVEYEEKEVGKPTFKVAYEKIAEDKWRVTVSEVAYGGYIDKWQVKYQQEEDENWSTSDNLSFVVRKDGTYKVKVVNHTIESEELSISI